MQAPKNLLQPFQLTDLHCLKNRIIMAPMTRNKSNDDLTATTAMADYYARRADAGLIITEGTIIRPDARAFTHVAGIFNQQQIDSWQTVTQAVHQQNGLIFLQLWHVGRASHPDFLDGQLPISASATVMTQRAPRANGLNHGQSRAVSADEIQGLISSYAQAAKNAIKAGFDGVEIHGANGYLIDQFLHYHTNHREDEFGGSPENMARFALEIVKACGNAIGFNRVGLRLSPGGYLNEIVGDSRDSAVFESLLTQLNSLPIAYVHTGNFDDRVKFPELNDLTMTQFIRQYYRGTLIACGSYSFSNAQEKIHQNEFDLIALGRPFIANPDLITRLQNQQEILNYDRSMLEILY